MGKKINSVSVKDNMPLNYCSFWAKWNVKRTKKEIF